MISSWLEVDGDDLYRSYYTHMQFNSLHDWAESLKLKTFVVFLFQVIEKALPEKMDTIDICAVISLCCIWIQYPTYSTCCEKGNAPLVLPTCPHGPAYMSMWDCDVANNSMKAIVILFLRTLWLAILNYPTWKYNKDYKLPVLCII